MEDNNFSERTLYDGRLHFHKRLDLLWVLFHRSLYERKYEDTITVLQDILVEKSGFISSTKQMEYIEKLHSIDNKLTVMNSNKVNSNSLNPKSIKKDLILLAIDLRMNTKRLYLPFDELDTDVDKLFEMIEKQSG